MMFNCGVQLSDDSGSLPGESPYIGKGRFYENEYAVGHRVHAKPREVQYAVVNGSTSTTAVSDVHAAVSQGQLGSINCDGDRQQQIDIEMQDKIHALTEGELFTISSLLCIQSFPVPGEWRVANGGREGESN